MSGENYIKRLERENAEKDAKLAAVLEWARNFESHLASPKFQVDTTIQVKDVFNWIANLKADL